MSNEPISNEAVQKAKEALDAHVREIVNWHFSADTGCPFWLDWASKAGWNPAEEVQSLDDLIAKFPHFQDEWLRDLQPEVWVPKAFEGQPFNVFETGGTTGMPKQRIVGLTTRSITASSRKKLQMSISRETTTG